MSLSTDTLSSALQTYSILGIGLLAGAQLSFTFVSVPALLSGASTAPASTIATQWKTLYDRAVGPVVTLSMTSTIGFAALAYRTATAAAAAATSSVTSPPGLTNTPPAASAMVTKRNFYIAAAVLAFSVAPYTRLVMWENISQLEKLAGAAGPAGKGTAGSAATQGLVQRWGELNLYRACMPLLSALCGLLAAVS